MFVECVIIQSNKKLPLDVILDFESFVGFLKIVIVQLRNIFDLLYNLHFLIYNIIGNQIPAYIVVFQYQLEMYSVLILLYPK